MHYFKARYELVSLLGEPDMGVHQDRWHLPNGKRLYLMQRAGDHGSLWLDEIAVRRCLAVFPATTTKEFWEILELLV